MEDMHARLDRVFAQLESRQPGLVAGVQVAGFPEYRRAFGASSLENGAPNTESTRMRIGSSTKQFTCFGALLLAQDGLLSIDDDIRTYVPGLPPYPQPVTLRRLMSNTGGLRCYLDLIGILASMDRSVPASVPLQLQLHQSSVNFASGERLIYCNGGYLLLSTAVERVAKKPLAEFLSERILVPLGMTDTLFEPYDTKLISGVATLHQRHPDGSYHRGTLGVPLTGDGAMISTVTDMLKWLAHMDAPVIGNAQTWQTMLTEGKNTEHGYGFGLMHDTYRGVPVIHHGGTVFGGRCQALKVPGRGINIVMMSNASDVFPADFTERVLDVLLDGDLAEPLVATSADKAKRFAGTYYSDTTGDVVEVLLKDDRAFVALESGDSPLFDAPRDSFRTNAASLGMSFSAVRDDVEHVAAIELVQGGYRAVLYRVQPSPNAQELGQWCGTYANTDCDAVATVSQGACPRLLIVSAYGSARYELEHLHGDVWYARLEESWFPLKLVMEFFTRGESSGFYLSSGRTKRLAFERT